MRENREAMKASAVLDLFVTMNLQFQIIAVNWNGHKSCLLISNLPIFCWSKNMGIENWQRLKTWVYAVSLPMHIVLLFFISVRLIWVLSNFGISCILVITLQNGAPNVHWMRLAFVQFVQLTGCHEKHVRQSTYRIVLAHTRPRDLPIQKPIKLT